MLISKILVAVDDSDFTNQTINFALELAKNLKATLAIVNVIDAAIVAVGADSVVFPMEQITELKKNAEDLISSIKQKLGNEITVEEYITEGKPSDEIIAVAGKINANLIVMGTHGRTGVMHLIMGSVAESVIRHSNIPVLVVPGKK